MKAKVATTWNDLKTKWKNATKNIKGKTAEMKAKIGTKWKDLKKKWQDLKDKFKGGTATFKANIKATVAKGYNTVAKAVNKLIDKHPVIFKHIPKLPIIKYAQGGWVNKNTPQLAVIGDNKHEAEYVAPESKLEAMARSVASKVNGGADAQVVSLLTQLLVAVKNMDTNVYLDGKQVADNTVRRINQQTRTTGVSPLLV